MVALLSIAQAEFTRADTGIVTDSQTGLEWQDSYVNNSVPYKYANDAINYCNDLDLEGTGWRLPNINELKSLIVDTQFAPSIDAVFQNTVNNYYWSSTTRKTSSDYRWSINFENATITNARPIQNSNYYSYIRCVR